MSLSAQELFNKLAVDLSPLLALPRIGDVAYNVDPFLKGTEQTKKFLENLGIKWWIHNDPLLWLLMDLQEVAHAPEDQQLEALKAVAFEYSLHTAVLDDNDKE